MANNSVSVALSAVAAGEATKTDHLITLTVGFAVFVAALLFLRAAGGGAPLDKAVLDNPAGDR